jgi:hypothetical protein
MLPAKLPGLAKAWRLTDSEASWKVACRSLHEAFRTNRLEHVVVAAYRRPSFVGEAAGSHGFVAVGWMQSMSLMCALLCEYACLYPICSLAPFSSSRKRLLDFFDRLIELMAWDRVPNVSLAAAFSAHLGPRILA